VTELPVCVGPGLFVEPGLGLDGVAGIAAMALGVSQKTPSKNPVESQVMIARQVGLWVSVFILI